MKNFNEDWNFILKYISQEPLYKLFREILPNISYKPLTKEIYDIFSVPLNSIKVVILHPEPYPYLTNIKRDFSKWEKQNVFCLPTSLTSEVGNERQHYDYWENMIKEIVLHISKNQPCIWFIPHKFNEVKFINLIQKPFIVKNYDEETIKDIPINADWNYIFTIPNKKLSLENTIQANNNNYYYINRVLEKLNKSTINW